MRCTAAFILVISVCYSSSLFAGPRGEPPTEGTINVAGDGFRESATSFVDVSSVFFLEMNYDGNSPLLIDTRCTSGLDTEIGLYDAGGTLVDSNDDIDFPQYPQSELVFENLPAGQYFLAVGLFNTTFGLFNFEATSTSLSSGDVTVRFITEVDVVLDGITNIALNYNFNGLVHADEPADPINEPDDPDGFRSISDRALDFRNGIPSDPILDRYSFVANGGDFDIVHLGNRNTVSGGVWMFDTEPDLDCVGIQPNWLADPDQSGRQTTILDTPVLMNSDSQVTLLIQVSNGGGCFDLVVGFTDGSEYSAAVWGPDWFGSFPVPGEPNIGIYDGAHGTDCAFLDPLGDNMLLITEAIVDLDEFSGMTANSVSFENATNPNSGVAILAANIVGGEADCLLGDVNMDGDVDFLDIQPFVDVLNAMGFQCEADVNQDGVVDFLDIQPFVDLLS